MSIDMERHSDQGGSSKLQALRERLPSGRKIATVAGVGLMGLATWQMHEDIAEAYDHVSPVIVDTFKQNQRYIALGLGGAAATLFGLSDHARSIRIRGRGKDFSPKVLQGASIAAAVVGAGVFAHNQLVTSQEPSFASAAENRSVMLASSCEVSTDGLENDEVDAARLQYWLWDHGYFGEDAGIGVVDGDYGEGSMAAVDRLQIRGLGVDEDEAASIPWNTRTCALIDEFVDGNDATPSFDEMPHLRFDRD